MRDIINLVEKLSKHSTVPPDYIQGRAPSPVGKYLFHGTTLINAVSIFRMNAITTGINWRGEGDRVSLTRSYQVAHEFGTYGDFGYVPVVFVLDWQRLVADFIVRPHDDPHADGSERHMPESEDGTEQEEAVYGAIQPLKKYLISCNIDPHVFEAAMTEEFASHVSDETDWNGKRVQAAIRKLAVSPVVNRVKP